MTNFTTTQPTAPVHAPSDPVRARAPRRAWLALAVLMLPTLLVSVDNTVLSFALPAISRDLAPTAAQQLWIIDAYPLVLAGLLVAMGSAGDRYGRRRMLLIGSIGFTVRVGRRGVRADRRGADRSPRRARLLRRDADAIDALTAAHGVHRP